MSLKQGFSCQDERIAYGSSLVESFTAALKLLVNLIWNYSLQDLKAVSVIVFSSNSVINLTCSWQQSKVCIRVWNILYCYLNCSVNNAILISRELNCKNKITSRENFFKITLPQYNYKMFNCYSKILDIF